MSSSAPSAEPSPAAAQGRCRAAVVSVGGTPDPVITFLSHARPEFVLFVVSPESRVDVGAKILPALDFAPNSSYCELENSDDIAACHHAIRRKIPNWLEEFQLDPNGVVVDITGGKKTMSAALTLAGCEHFRHFSYIGGEREGLGTVISGREKPLRTLNPWDGLALRSRELATALFGENQADAAARVLGEAADRATTGSEIAAEIDALAEVCKWLAQADRFEFKHPKTEDRWPLVPALRRQQGELRKLSVHFDGVRKELKEGSGDAPAPHPETLRELLANADRRAAQGRFDDAVARLYRAAELYAQDQLAAGFGARLGKVELTRVPAEHREEFARDFAGREDGESARVYKLGVRDAFAALRFAADPGLKAHADDYSDLKNPLSRRNELITGHGLAVASREDYDGLRAPLLALLGMAEEDLPVWPRLDFTLE